MEMRKLEEQASRRISWPLLDRQLLNAATAMLKHDHGLLISLSEGHACHFKHDLRSGVPHRIRLLRLFS